MECKKCNVEFENKNFNPNNVLIGEGEKVGYFCDDCWNEMDLKELTAQRNKLSRQISSLKKVNLKQ